GLVQWTSAVITQAERLANATISISTPEALQLTTAALWTETDLFIAATWKVLEFRKWVSALGLRPSIDFSEIDKFDTQATRDLRNMREHVVDYFQGVVTTKLDGSSRPQSSRLTRRGPPRLQSFCQGCEATSASASQRTQPKAAEHLLKRFPLTQGR